MAPTNHKTPAKGSAGDKMKQKSLMAFFNKSSAPAASTPDAKSKSRSGTNQDRVLGTSKATHNRVHDAPSSDIPEAHTPSSKGASQRTVAESPHGTHSSNVPSSPIETPPTSDAIDVDMLSDEDVPMRKQITTTQKAAPATKKRKIVIEDSDEELEEVDAVAYRKGLSVYEPSPEPKRTRENKKARVVSDEDEQDAESDDAAVASFSKRLTKFKPPVISKLKGPGRKSTDDDDDFIVPDDDDEDDDDEQEVSSSRAPSRSSSRLSDYAHTSASEAEDGETEVGDSLKRKSKSKKERPAPGKTCGSKGGSGDMFLTAAERRALKQKEEKKSTEDPFEFLQDIRDKDGVRPGEPGYDPRTLYVPPKAWKSFTPFEKQFWEIKQYHYDTVLFFQKGKFLELYEEDARIGHQEFDLKLTQRVKMSMVGVPEQSFNLWAAKFLAKGYKVGRVDQSETALGAEMRVAAGKGKGKQTAADKGGDKIVRRELNKVYTNGTLVDEALLTDEQAGHCVSIREEGEEDAKTGKQNFGLCVLDSSTSEFNLSAFEDDVCRTKLETIVRQLRPKEVIFTKGNLSVPTSRLLKVILPGNCLWTTLRESEGLTYDKTIKELRALYPPSDDGDGDTGPHGLSSSVPEAIRSMVMHHGAMEALGSMIWYLGTLNIDKDILTMKNFNIYDPMKRGQGLVLDGQTLAHIEVLLNSEGTDDGTLLKLLGRCITPSGKRLFRIWLCMPLREIKDINDRLDAVEDLIEHPTFESEFSDVAKGLPDLERIVSRIHAKNCRVKDFLKVLESFKKLNSGLLTLAETADSFKTNTISGLLRKSPDLSNHLKHVRSMFKKPEDNGDELIPQEGKDEEYDAVTQEISNLEEELADELKRLKKELGVDLSYWHSAQGTKDIYLVQTKANDKKLQVPKGWLKGGGTKAFNRWVVPDLASTIRSLKEARENRNTAVKNFRTRVYTQFDTDRGVYLTAVRVLSELDCLFSLAKASVALGEPSCRPEFVESDSAFLDFEELRHPALNVSAGFRGDFIPNDVKLGGEVARIALLTGPNMGGKSTAMRMSAVGVIMAQLGMMVPAKKARLSPVDAILTRMGAYDNMFSNASTFKVELDECCKILREATPKSLVILDELGRGTSTYDGMAIAGAVLHELATQTLAMSFFATHYGSLTDDFSYHPNIRNMHMATLVDDEKRELVFLYKLTEGVAESSFGTHVANLAGVPLSVVERADVVSKDFAKQFKEKLEGKRKDNRASSKLSLVAQADFAYLYKLATGKCELPTDEVRRREVLKGLKAAVGAYLRQASSSAEA